VSEKAQGFAERLRALRDGAGLSQYALAKRSGLTKQALSRLELGEREPTWQTVQLLALALNVDYGEFADPELTLPEGADEPRPRGRPRKAEPPPAAQPGEGKAKAKKGKG
jgi:transcriptional regulator with XRE-family HTH domain